MGLFCGSLKFVDIKESLNGLADHIINLITVVSRNIIENIVLIAKAKTGKILNITDVYDKTYLFAYSIITIGSYLNGKKLIKGQEWEKTLEYIIKKYKILME